MKKSKIVVARSSAELAHVLGLSPEDAIEMEIRRELNDKIIQVVKRQGLTHLQVANAAKTSRTRVTAIMNRNTHEISTDLMLRILVALGYTARITFSKTNALSR